MAFPNSRSFGSNGTVREDTKINTNTLLPAYAGVIRNIKPSYRNSSSAAPRHNPGNYAKRRDASRPYNAKSYNEELEQSAEYQEMMERKRIQEKVDALPKLPELTDPTWFESSDEETKLERIRQKRKVLEERKKRNLKLMTKEEAKDKFNSKMAELRNRVPGQRNTTTSDGFPLLPNPMNMPTPFDIFRPASDVDSSDDEDEDALIERRRRQRKELYNRLNAGPKVEEELEQVEGKKKIKVRAKDFRYDDEDDKRREERRKQKEKEREREREEERRRRDRRHNYSDDEEFDSRRKLSRRYDEDDDDDGRDRYRDETRRDRKDRDRRDRSRNRDREGRRRRDYDDYEDDERSSRRNRDKDRYEDRYDEDEEDRRRARRRRDRDYRGRDDEDADDYDRDRRGKYRDREEKDSRRRRQSRSRSRSVERKRRRSSKSSEVESPNELEKTAEEIEADKIKNYQKIGVVVVEKIIF